MSCPALRCASVAITAARAPLLCSVVTDADGQYRFDRLPGGTVELTAALRGRRPGRIAVLSIPAVSRYHIVLGMAAVRGTVRDAGTGPMLTMSRR